MITPVAISSIGYRYYIVYACIGICVPFMVYLYFPESMGRSLEEMDLIFSDSTSVGAVVRASLTQKDHKVESRSFPDKEGVESGSERIEHMS